MKQNLLVATFTLLLLIANVYAQSQGYIYVHQKTLNEQAAVDFTYNLYKGSTASGSPVATFQLNSNPAYVNAADIGASHSAALSTAGDGELWCIANGTSGTSPNNITGTIYHRPSASSQWTALTSGTGVTSATAIDGAYTGQCVFISNGSIYFYYNGTTTRLYNNTGTAATDVAAAAGKVVAIIGGRVRTYALTGAYTAITSPLADQAFTNLNLTGTRVDISADGNTIVYANNGNAYTTPFQYITTPTPVGTAVYTAATNFAASVPDVAYDDKGYIYVVSRMSANGDDAVWTNVSGTFTLEPQGRRVVRITGGVAGQAWGVINYNITAPGKPNTIWSRVTNGSTVWFDDERVRTASTGSMYAHPNNAGTQTAHGEKNGSGIMIPVDANTQYTLVQTLPAGNWDLGRFTTYTPAGNTTDTFVSTQTVQFKVATGSVTHVEYIDELLSPKAIALNCTLQSLETFGTGANTYGDTVQGTAYHYIGEANAEDGDYFVVKNAGNFFGGSTALVSQENDGGYFMIINASYAQDEFYRKRVTNLVPGLTYIISFYAANVNPGQPLLPNVSYGLQDLSGNIINVASTGDIPATQTTWEQFSLTFTATQTTADLFLRNNTIGGSGNDIAIDEIALNPVLTALPDITVSPAIAPNICIGTTYQFSNSFSPGTWQTSNSAVATISPTGAVNGLTAGSSVITYRYVNAQGCVSTKTTGIVVSAPPSSVTVTDKYGGSICRNQQDSIFATAVGGTGPFAYAWTSSSPPADGFTAAQAALQNIMVAPTAAGSYTYTVTATDPVGCSASNNITLAVSAKDAPTVSVTASAGCFGSPIQLTATGSGGSGGYTYAWTGSPTGNGLTNPTVYNPTANPTAIGTYLYSLTFKDAFCTIKSAVQVTVGNKPVINSITASPTGALCVGSSIALTSSVTAGSSAALVYSWTGAYKSGPDNPGNAGLQSPTNTSSVTAIPTITNSSGTNSSTKDTYTYTLTVSDGNSCSASLAQDVTVWKGSSTNAPTVTITSPTSTSGAVAVCSGSGISLTATATAPGGGTNTYSWTGPGGYTSTTLSPGTVTPSASGVYVITVTNGSCKASDATPQININSLPSVTPTSFAADICIGTTTPTVDSLYATGSGGTGPYTYAWTNTSKPSGANTVSFTPKTPGDNDTVSINNINKSGNYNFQVTVTDANACAGTNTIQVVSQIKNGPAITSMPAAGTLCINTTNTLTPGITVGDASITTYAWSASPSSGAGLTAGTTTATAKPTAAGTYTYTLKVTDGNGCADISQTGLQTVNPVMAVVPISPETGFCASGTAGNATGTLDLTAVVSGGSGVYNYYAWTANRTVSPGSVSFVPATSNSTPITVATLTGGTIGTTKYTFTIVVNDDAGCAATGTTGTFNVNGKPTISSISVTPATTACVGKVINLTGNFSGTTSSYNYVWTSNSSSSVTNATGTVTASPVTTTASTSSSVSGYYPYSFTVTDANGCLATASDSTLIYGRPSASIAPQNCGTSSDGRNYVELVESNGSTWTWTSADGNARFYTSAALSFATDSSTSHLQGPFVTLQDVYNVTISDSHGCTNTGTYTVNSSTCGSTVLPIRLLSFTAQKQESKVALNWSTISEINSNYFVVERSGDNNKWQEIGSVKSHNNSSTLQTYSFNDLTPLNGANYYRLKQVDMDGKTAYSEVRMIIFAAQWAVHVYPNPASDFIVLEFNNDKEERASISVQTTLGSTVFMKEQKIVKGFNRIVLNQIQPLAQGTYIISMATSTNLHRSRFVKGDR